MAKNDKKINILMRNIPSVDLVLGWPGLQSMFEEIGKEKLTDIIRESLKQIRKDILLEKIRNEEELSAQNIEELIRKNIKIFSFKKLQKVINATGVVIHTNLGRAPLSSEVLSKSMDTIRYYSNLEYYLEDGKRGSRHEYLKDLITRLTGAEDAIVVNNNAAAVLLILSTFAKDREVIVSRGELVEIGGSFRIPSVMSQSGAKLVEVGTTNKTHERDYEEAITENTALLMKIHTSNYSIMGFTQSVGLNELKSIGEKYHIPVVEDLGSGVLVDLRKYGLAYEPTVQDSIRKGADIISFSGDKLLGGPQAGIIIGKKEYIDQMKKNQLLRALRVDKVIISLLYHTLNTYFDEKQMEKNIPVIHMLSLSAESVKQKAVRLKEQLLYDAQKFTVEIRPCQSQVGGGSLPTELIDSYGIYISSAEQKIHLLEKKLRLADEHIITRIQNDKLIMDLRTVFEVDMGSIAHRLNALWKEM